MPMMNELAYAELEKARAAAKSGDLGTALEHLDTLEKLPGLAVSILVWKSVILRLHEGPRPVDALDEAERCLLEAFAIDPGNLDVLEELAHFYDTIRDDREKAVEFAALFLGEFAAKGRAAGEIRKIVEGRPHLQVP